MHKKNRPLYLGLLAGVLLMGVGAAYESLWCDPRAPIGASAEPEGAHRLSRDGVTV
ncbi:hypothetical protein G3435_24360, partial [Pseudomonas sp. MAFF212428]|nr:hypothetical protein [Pseudomonas brassicae]